MWPKKKHTTDPVQVQSDQNLNEASTDCSRMAAEDVVSSRRSISVAVACSTAALQHRGRLKSVWSQLHMGLRLQAVISFGAMFTHLFLTNLNFLTSVRMLTKSWAFANRRAWFAAAACRVHRGADTHLSEILLCWQKSHHERLHIDSEDWWLDFISSILSSWWH